MTFKNQKQGEGLLIVIIQKYHKQTQGLDEIRIKIITSSLGIIADLASPSSFFLLNAKNMSSSAALFPAFS